MSFRVGVPVSGVFVMSGEQAAVRSIIRILEAGDGNRSRFATMN